LEKTWEQALGRITYGIYVLTTSYGEEMNGMIASWVSQVSYEPPLVMSAVHPNRYSHRLVTESGCFALNALAKNQADFVARFKGPDAAAKFDSIDWFKGKAGCPILKGCVAYLECEVMVSYRPGNHTLFIGRVQDARVLSEDEPLSTRDYAKVYLGKH
jgi:flavin reductase (DIM6/NTAB) family NADH-FMN oxidoreductase RutF